MKKELQHVKHPWGSLYYADSEILILGSFPSPKSRETDFFYGHPQNRFLQVLSQLCDETIPRSIEDKKALLKRHCIALWDVIDECDICGASDASVRNAVPTKLSCLFEKSSIRAVYCNGSKSFELYQKCQFKETGIPAIRLPSTSPANAACSLQKLAEEWRVLLTAA